MNRGIDTVKSIKIHNTTELNATQIGPQFTYL